VVDGSPFEGIFICVVMVVVGVGCVFGIRIGVKEEFRVFGRGGWFLVVFVFVVFVDALSGMMFSLSTF